MPEGTDIGTAILFLVPIASFIALCYFLARFLIRQGRRDR